MRMVRMILRIIIQPEEKNNESVRKKKKRDHSGFITNPRKVDKNRKGLLFFLDLEPFICGFTVFKIASIRKSPSDCKVLVNTIVS